MKELDFKHYFRLVNGKFIWKDKQMFEFIKRSLEGKEGFAIIKEIEHDVTPNQYAYYFGGIIRKECMVSETFGGCKEGEIHNYLLKEIEGTVKQVKMKDGSVRHIEIVPDFSLFGKRKMAEYIEKVIALLQTEYGIYPKPAEHYKYNRFYIKPKVFKNEDLERNRQSCTEL